MNYDTQFPSLKNTVSAQEWHARVQLAACYRLIDYYGMSDLIYNHITASIPGTDHFLINLYGLLYKEITASSLVKIDLAGNIITTPNTVPAMRPINALVPDTEDASQMRAKFL